MTFVTRDRALGLWDWEAGAVARTTRRELVGPDIAVTPDFRWLATRASGNRALVYDLRADREVMTLPPESAEIYWADWSPDGQRLALGLSDGGVVIWDIKRVRAQLSDLGVAIP
jgi:WD40 repeat protein